MKKRNLLLSLLLAGSLVTPVFADNANQSNGESTPAIYLKKVLKTPTGTSLPEEGFTFEFNFDLVSHDGTTDLNTLQEYKDILKKKTIKVTSDSKVNDSSNPDVTEYSATIDVLSDVEFTGAGEYIYKVDEINPSSPSSTNDESNNTGTIEYDPDFYTLRILVKNGGDDSTYVSSVEIVHGKQIEPGKSPELGDKISATDSETTGFVFTNKYTKNAGSTNPDQPVNEESAALVISKTVTRQDNKSDLIDNAREFDFTLTLVSNSFDPISSQDDIHAFIDGKQVFFKSEDTNFTAEFKLKNGQKLIINSLPGGTKYSVVETGTTNYLASAEVTVGGVATGSSIMANDIGENLTVSDKLISSDGINRADVKNEFQGKTASPTGIIINNLPYILLVVVGVAGIALYEAGRRRFNN